MGEGENREEDENKERRKLEKKIDMKKKVKVICIKALQKVCSTFCTCMYQLSTITLCKTHT